MRKLLYIPLVLIFLFAAHGCGCTSDNQQVEKDEPEQTEHIDPDFNGPTTEPFSVGPTEPPPSE